MYEVRFHVGSGPHYKHWQVRGPGGVEYHDPEERSLVLRGCVLRNRRAVAEEVFASKRRDVCGKVLCESVEVLDHVVPPEGRIVHFDPKVRPFWTVEGLEGPQDGTSMPVLVSSGRRLRIPAYSATKS